MPEKTFDVKSILVQVMAWCRTWGSVDQDMRRHMTSQGYNVLLHFINWFIIDSGVGDNPFTQTIADVLSIGPQEVDFSKMGIKNTLKIIS